MEGDRKVDVRLDPEDDALLLRAWQLRCGRLGPRGRTLAYQHIVLDEVQDFSPVEVQVLLETTDKNKSVTLAGDTRQHISKDAGFSSWQEFLQRIGVESTALSTLEISYRSTHTITRFAIDVLGTTDEPMPHTRREGPPVELFRFGDHGACVAFLAEELRQLQRAEPNANVALLTPTQSLARCTPTDFGAPTSPTSGASFSRSLPLRRASTSSKSPRSRALSLTTSSSSRLRLNTGPTPNTIVACSTSRPPARFTSSGSRPSRPPHRSCPTWFGRHLPAESL